MTVWKVGDGVRLRESDQRGTIVEIKPPPFDYPYVVELENGDIMVNACAYDFKDGTP